MRDILAATFGSGSYSVKSESELVTRGAAKGEGKVKDWKRPTKLQIQIGVILVLVFIIWIMLQNPARWG
jgi:hypothetical protein